MAKKLDARVSPLVFYIQNAYLVSSLRKSPYPKQLRDSKKLIQPKKTKILESTDAARITSNFKFFIFTPVSDRHWSQRNWSDRRQDSPKSALTEGVAV